MSVGRDGHGNGKPGLSHPPSRGQSLVSTAKHKPRPRNNTCSPAASARRSAGSSCRAARSGRSPDTGLSSRPRASRPPGHTRGTARAHPAAEAVSGTGRWRRSWRGVVRSTEVVLLTLSVPLAKHDRRIVVDDVGVSILILCQWLGSLRGRAATVLAFRVPAP